MRLGFETLRPGRAHEFAGGADGAPVAYHDRARDIFAQIRRLRVSSGKEEVLVLTLQAPSGSAWTRH